MFWGINDGFEMNVLGFSEAYSASLSFCINGLLEVRVAGFIEQFVLKLFAWQDRQVQRGVDDAADLAFFLRNAEVYFPTERLHDEYSEIVERVEYDMSLAACCVLGKSIGSVFSGTTVEAVSLILNEAVSNSCGSVFISDIAYSFPEWNDPEERVLKLIEQVLLGIRDKQ